MANALTTAPPLDVKLLPVMDLEQAKQHLKQLKDFVHFYLEEGIDKDYGLIPGSLKPSLFRPGAQKLCDVYGMRAEFEILKEQEEWDRTMNGQPAPLFCYRFLCRLVRKSDGLEMAQAVGLASSYEAKHLWRTTGKTCPVCEVPALSRSKAEYGGGWYCADKKGGCGGSWKAVPTSKYTPKPEELAMVQEINNQPVGRSVNDDLFGVQNTIIQMAQKRAMVPATIAATRSSQLFTSDAEDRDQIIDPIASDGRRTEFVEEAGKLGWYIKDIQPYLTATFGLPSGKIKENITVSMCDKALIHFRMNPITDATEVKGSDPKSQATDHNKPKGNVQKPKPAAKDTTSGSQNTTSPGGTAAKESGSTTGSDPDRSSSPAQQVAPATTDAPEPEDYNDVEPPDFSGHFGDS